MFSGHTNIFSSICHLEEQNISKIEFQGRNEQLPCPHPPFFMETWAASLIIGVDLEKNVACQIDSSAEVIIDNIDQSSGFKSFRSVVLILSWNNNGPFTF